MGLVCEKAKGKKKEKERGMITGKKTTTTFKCSLSISSSCTFCLARYTANCISATFSTLSEISFRFLHGWLGSGV